MEIRKVWKAKRKDGDRLYISIPSNSSIQEGDFVSIDKVRINENRTNI
jgi:hypothetical protein